MFQKKQNNKGFTLIELIVVIAIIAILAAIAVPAFTGLTRQAEAAAIDAEAKMICQAINAYSTLNPNDGRWMNVGDPVKYDFSFIPFWPVNLSHETEALSRIEISSDGVATLKPAS